MPPIFRQGRASYLADRPDRLRGWQRSRSRPAFVFSLRATVASTVSSHGMSSIHLHGVSKTYPGGVVALCPLNLSVNSGERLALVGPSGSGKTTVLRLISGLETPDTGRIEIDGNPVDAVLPHRRGVGLLTQRPALYPHLTVGQNIGPATSETLDLLRLRNLLDRYPHQLSGGERQRAALVKLLTANRPIWLLDEPFAGLDRMFRSEFRHDLHLLLDRTAATMILVTHDPTDARAFGCRVAVLGGGQLQQLGTPEELEIRPNTRFVAACLGRLNLINGHAMAGVGDGDLSERHFRSECGWICGQLPTNHRLGREPNFTPSLTLGFRPEDVFAERPDHPANPAFAVVLDDWPAISAEPVGSGWMLTVARGRTSIRVWQSSGSPPPVGHSTRWCVPADRCVWFDGRTGHRIVHGSWASAPSS